MKLLSTPLVIMMLSLPLAGFSQNDCQLRTQTPGGWGAPANGNNPGVYRDMNFDAAFPEGVFIGCDENNITFTSAQAIEDYLPCGGQPQVLSGSYTNPNCLGNVFTGHLLALTLSVGFDLNDEDFGPAETNLIDAVIQDGNFEGWSVGEVVQLANDVLGGCNSEYSPSEVKSVLASINENYVDGDQNNGFLDCDEGCPDTEAPVVEFCPSDEMYECSTSFDIPEPEFSDASDFTVEMTSETSVENCTITTTYTFIATDECENTASCAFSITLTDTTAPIFTSTPDDLVIECASEIPPSQAEAEDECNEVSIETSEVFEAGECPGTGVVIRTFVATDACGNEAEYIQTIEIIDSNAPIFSEYPENITLSCGEAIPTPPVIQVMDECDPDVTVEFTEEIGDAQEGCTLLLPENDTYPEDWALFLPEFDLDYEYYGLLQGSWTEVNENDVLITATFVSIDNPNGGWEAEILLENGLNWEEWSNQEFPTSYKDDFDLAGNEYLNWTYYLISGTSTLTGWGDFDGSFMSISHAPSSLYYGYQYGVAANNVNAEFGSGGWFNYTGNFNDSSVDYSEDILGIGDFAFDHSCCESPQVTWTWIASDCAGNTETHVVQILYTEIEQSPALVQIESGTLCPGDFDTDGHVNTGDFLFLLTEYGREGTSIADINEDERVDLADMLSFLGNFGSTCQ